MNNDQFFSFKHVGAVKMVEKVSNGVSYLPINMGASEHLNIEHILNTTNPSQEEIAEIDYAIDRMKICTKADRLAMRDALLNKYPDSAICSYELVRILEWAKEYDLALQEAERLLKFEPENPLFINEVGYAHVLKGNSIEAIDAFQKSYDRGCRLPEMMACFAGEWINLGKKSDTMLSMLRNAFGDTFSGEDSFPQLNTYIFEQMMKLSHGSENKELKAWAVKLICNYVIDVDYPVTDPSRIAIYLMTGVSGLTYTDMTLETIVCAFNKFLAMSDKAEDQNLCAYSRNMAILNYMLRDERLFEGVICLYEGFNVAGEDDRLKILDGILCCYSHKDTAKATIELIKSDYAFAYDQIKEYLDYALSLDESKQFIITRFENELFGLICRGLGRSMYFSDHIDAMQRVKGQAIKTGVIMIPAVGRNDPCPCRSGKKFKHCCMGKHIFD